MDTFEWACKLGISRESLMRMVANDAKIVAIKDVRQHLKIGLREAKAVVEYFQASAQFKQLCEFTHDAYQEIANRKTFEEAQYVQKMVR